MGDRGGAGDGAGLVEPQPAGPRDPTALAYWAAGCRLSHERLQICWRWNKRSSRRLRGSRLKVAG